MRPHVKIPPCWHNLPFKKIISAKNLATTLCCYIWTWETKKNSTDWTFLCSYHSFHEIGIPLLLSLIPCWINGIFHCFLKGTFVNSLIYWINSPSSHQMKGKSIHFNWRGNSIQYLLKPLYQCILNGIHLINSNESQWYVIFQWDWLESHYVSM